MNYDPDRKIVEMTFSELKTLIKECLREFAGEKQRATNASAEEQYKQLWIKPTVVTEDGFKCNG